MGMNLLINAARREMRGPKTESGIYFPSSRGFMDDLTLTTATHVQARWMLAALTDIVSWGRMKFKAVKSDEIHADDVSSGAVDDLNCRIVIWV